MIKINQEKTINNSKITVNDLLNFKLFKKNINERVKEIGNFEYKGSKKIMDFYRMYFIAISKADKNNKRYKICVIIDLPEDFPKNNKIRIFSSDKSFKYYFAYILYKNNALILSKKIIRHLGKALLEPPKIKNKNFNLEFTKHIFKIIKYIKINFNKMKTKKLKENYDF